MLGRLKYTRISSKEMKQGERYMTLLKETLWMGERETLWMVGKLERVTTCATFSSVCVYTDKFQVERRLSEMRIPLHMVFYQVESRKQYIQNEMENRALQMILQRVVGDPCFTWCNGS